MPEHVGQLARRAEPTDRADRREEELLSLVRAGSSCSMRRCPKWLDRGTVFEIGRMWGRACITALARPTAGR